MQDRAFANPKIEFVWNSEVVRDPRRRQGQWVTLRDTVTGESRELAVTGLFIAIGHDPRSELVTGQVDLDDDGYVLVDHPLHPHQPRRACSPPATWSTTTTGRRSPRPAPAVPRHSTPSATSQTSTTRPRRLACRLHRGRGRGPVGEQRDRPDRRRLTAEFAPTRPRLTLYDAAAS